MYTDTKASTLLMPMNFHKNALQRYIAIIWHKIFTGPFEARALDLLPHLLILLDGPDLMKMVIRLAYIRT